ncbi:MAG: hypothetical protein COA58_03160 [Bacteroidetes bacterium]|nr:MAG: hypothetical protein COA58_03160 [Bacteroidota bacterium]
MVDRVTAKSTDFPLKEDLIEEIRNNRFSFHHVTKSHLSYAGAYQEPEKFLPFAAQYIKKMKDESILIKEKQPTFYLYEQVRKDGKKFKGIIALCSIQDYHNNRIKKHEEIRPSRLKFLVELFKTTKIMGEPTLLAHNGKINLKNIVSDELLDFKTPDGKRHIVRGVCNPDDMASIQEQMSAIENFYIADGHHRSASAAAFNQQVNRLSNDLSMCFIVEEEQLEILPFHRLIKPVIEMELDALLGELSTYFKVTKSEQSVYEVKERHIFGLYVDRQWYRLEAKESSDKVDIEILEDIVVRKIFGIADSRTDSQITFHSHSSGENLMTQLVDSKTYNVAFTSKACSFSEVRMVSDRNQTLPPKSTYIEPKLRAGMIIQEFEILPTSS